jgi:hypothetical protein
LTITRNPYGVGESGVDKRTEFGRCSCCDLSFSYEVIRTRPVFRDRCDACGAHYETDGEPVERTLARYQAHDAALRARADAAAAAATQYEKEVAQSRERVRSALRTRDSWQRLALELYIAHEDKGGGKCRCGLRYPCPTITVVENSSRPLARRLELMASQPEPLPEPYDEWY